jgi:hypothetical protein
VELPTRLTGLLPLIFQDPEFSVFPNRNNMTLCRRLWSIIRVIGFILVLFSTALAFAQELGNSNAAGSSSLGTPAAARDADQVTATARDDPEPPGGKRVFGVLPNYRTVDGANVTSPLTNAQKFSIASKDSFDYPLVLLSGALAGIGQWSKQDPSFGQGMAGFGKRLASNFSDQALGNMMTEAVFPVLLHEDPRYYRRGTGNIWSRTGYAFSTIFVTHTDSATVRFNYSEWVGNATATAISNAYYPDGRRAGANVGKLVEQCSLDGLGQVLKELWPDIKKKFFEHPAIAPSGH